MTKSILISILLISITLHSIESQSASDCSIIDNLSSKEPSIVEKTFQSFTLERGILGLSGIRFLYPWIIESDKRLLVTAISWEGPYDGYIILIDSVGNVLDKKRVGYIKYVSLRANKIGGNDILVLDAKSSGTGFEQDHYMIFAISSNRFDNIWNELSYEKSFPLNLAPDQNYEIKSSLDFDDVNNDGIQEILYTMTKLKYSFNTYTKKLSPGKTEKTTKVYKLVNGKYILDKGIGK